MLRLLWCSFRAVAMLKSVKPCAVSAKAWYHAAVSMCYSSDCEVVCGENVVRKGRKCMLILAVVGSVAGFLCLVSL